MAVGQGGPSEFVNLYYTLSGSSAVYPDDYVIAVSAIENTGYYEWTVPAELDGKSILVKAVADLVSVPSELLYLDEEEISMMTVDGSTFSSYTLTPVFSGDSIIYGLMSWQSSNPSVATVDNNGLVSAIGPGITNIICNYGSTSGMCTVTVYETVPDMDTLYTLKGGTGPGSIGTHDDFVSFENITNVSLYQSATEHPGIQSNRVISRSYMDTSGNSFGSVYLEPPYTSVRVGLEYYTYSTYHINRARIGINGQIGKTVPGVYEEQKFQLLNGWDWDNGANTKTDIARITHGGLGTDFIDGTVKYIAAGSSGNFSASEPEPKIELLWKEKTSKIIYWTADEGYDSVPSIAQTLQKEHNDLFYIPQCYIRYTDNGTRTDYTEIVNLGGLGYPLNVSANNTPSVWFDGNSPWDLLRIEESYLSMMTVDGSTYSSYQLNPVFTTSSAIPYGVEWYSSNNSIATVNSTGLVSAITSGDCTITCVYDSLSASTNVTVYDTIPNFDDLYLLSGGNGDGYTTFTGFRNGQEMANQSYFVDLILDDSVLSTIGVRSYSSVGTFTAPVEINVAGTVTFYHRVQNTTSYTEYETLSRLEVGESRVKVSYGSEGYYLNDVNYSLGSTQYNPETAAPYRLYFGGQNKKVVAVGTNTSLVDNLSLSAYGSMDAFFIPQNFILYTDTDTRTNYTVIPNLGLSGSSFDVSANDVPNEWFIV